jgi:hypothetical protein
MKVILGGEKIILVYFWVHTSSTTHDNMAIGIIMAIGNLTKHLILALKCFNIAYWLYTTSPKKTGMIPQEDLARFGYMLKMKVKILNKNPSLF